MVNLNHQIQDFSRSQKELEYKLECNDKFWQQKVNGVAAQNSKLNDQNLVQKRKIQALRAELKEANEEKKTV